MKELYDVTDADIRKVWELHPDESEEMWKIHLQAQVSKGKVKMSLMLDKYKQYLEMCKKEGREQRYISRFKNFLSQGMYMGEFNYSNKSGNIAKMWLDGLP